MQRSTPSPSPAAIDREPAREQASVSPPDPSLWANCQELDAEVSQVTGQLPRGLRGQLLRNGPAKRDLGTYFWDGDGMVRALDFRADGSLRYRQRYIHTRKYLAERHASAPVYRSAGTQRPGGILANMFRLPQTEANTHLLAHAGKLWALHEGGHPYRLDPQSFDTLEHDHFGDALKRTITFSAHPHADPETGDVFNFGLEGGLTGANVHAYRLTPEGRLVHLAKAPIARMTFMHDFALSDRWLIFFVPPVNLSMPRMLLGIDSALDAFRWEKGATAEVLMISRDGREQRRFELEPHIMGHSVVTREVGDEVVVDFVRAPTWDKVGDGLADYRSGGMAFTESMCLWRYRFDTRNGRVQSELLHDRPCDFPRGDERKPQHAQRTTYLAANPPGHGGLFRGTLKLDTRNGKHDFFDFGPGHVTQEPVFVPAAGKKTEDGGWVVQFVHNDARKATDCAIFDARKLADGPLATVHLPVSAGMTFHGTWVD